MIRRLLLVICLFAAALAPPASAAPASARKSGATVKRSAAPAKRSAAPAKRSAAPAKRPVAQKTAKTDSTARMASGPRRLEDIHIEGEIPAPQVLFVTARDQRRFTRFHHQRYLKTSVQVGETTQLPTRIALTSHPPTPAGTP